MIFAGQRRLPAAAEVEVEVEEVAPQRLKAKMTIENQTEPCNCLRQHSPVARKCWYESEMEILNLMKLEKKIFGYLLLCVTVSLGLSPVIVSVVIRIVVWRIAHGQEVFQIGYILDGESEKRNFFIPYFHEIHSIFKMNKKDKIFLKFILLVPQGLIFRRIHPIFKMFAKYILFLPQGLDFR